ncbi:protoporphyrinogen oxidase [Haladaptatus halobius]|uniref:protoporphyrinogen oxidase n=1 Tax=Haladaptatus halobius TaxID=2884875 RepID=UPI001D09EE21|nr:protoporphyrinogen oxidase [Haladaptatus halobius]
MPERSLRPMTVGIVGAGITGLALAHHLDKGEVEYVVLEADDEPGGVIRSGRVNGYLLEWGPQRLRRTNPVDELITDLGLDDEVIEAGDTKLFVYANGALRRAPFSIEEFGHTDLLSWRGKLDVLKEPQTAPAEPDETAAKLFTRKFGEEVYENLLGPLFGGTYGSEPERMPVEHALSGVMKLEQKYGSLLEPALKRAMAGGTSAPAISFEEGVQTLPETLYDAHAENVRLETPVTEVRETEDGYVLETDAEEFAVNEVVVTTPAAVSADLLATLAPTAASALERLNYNPLALVHLRADCDRDGFGYQVRNDEGLDTLGVSWNASMFGRDGVYTVFLGGMRNPELVEEDDETLGSIAATEFEKVMDAEADVLNVARLRRGFPAYDTSWDALDEVRMPEGVHLATNYTARMGVPSRIREARQLAESLANRA